MKKFLMVLLVVGLLGSCARVMIPSDARMVEHIGKGWHVYEWRGNYFKIYTNNMSYRGMITELSDYQEK